MILKIVPLLRRQDALVLPYGIFSVDRAGRFGRAPNIDGAIAGALGNGLDRFRRRVLDDARLAVGAVAGDDAADGRKRVAHFFFFFFGRLSFTSSTSARSAAV